MKAALCVLMITLCLIISLCGFKQNTEGITNMKIPVEDVTEFYYTVSNINYNAFYQRYHFYVEDGKYMFHHETREKSNDYGPTTEEDITKAGIFELSAEEWMNAFDLLEDGTVRKRTEDTSTGSSGPWTYIYWKGDKGKYQEYIFSSYQARHSFEEYCAALAQEDR